MTHRRLRAPVLTALIAALLPFGCGEETDGGNGLPPGSTLCDPAADACSDDAILDLQLQTSVASGLITNTADGSGWATHIDATAGGFGANPPHAYVYARFADAGMEKVAIDDEASLDSLDWDIAFRRYIIRINSGASGPSCTTAAPLASNITYDGVTEVPAVLVDNASAWREDDYYTASCDLISDTFGLGSPQTALMGFWSYQTCVEMTGTVFIIERRDGRHVKLVVSSYYSPSVQADCDAGNGLTTPSGSGNMRLRWEFLD